jgi:dihydroflavonol-4-reductase
MATLVTGATGFLGYHLVRALLASGTTDIRVLVRHRSDTSRLKPLDVDLVVGDILDPETLVEPFRDVHIVYHVAAAVHLGAVTLASMRETNVAGAVNVVRAATEAGARRIVYTSTIGAVGASRAPVAIDERAEWNLGPLGSPYLTTKREAELEVQALTRAGAPVVTVNPALIFGPDDFGPSEGGRFVQALALLQHLRAYASGGSNIVDVRDVASGLILAATAGEIGERYILGGENVSYERILATIAALRGNGAPLFCVPNRLIELASRAAPLVQLVLGAQHPLATFDPVSARVARWYFFYTSGKAERRLGYWHRPFDETIAETLAFFAGADGARRA